MRVSVLVISYNRREMLDQTLFYISNQERLDSFEIETIVVDHGSTDQTHELVEHYQIKDDNIVYIFHPRTQMQDYNPAGTRNIGIQRSSGELIVFIDCGILLPPDFIKKIVERNPLLSNQVLVHYSVGLFAKLNESNRRKLTNLSPQNITQMIKLLAQDPEWVDYREGWFDMVSDQLDQLPAPWAFMWTQAMSVPKRLLEKVGGFDESFQGWGSEDTGLGYKLYQSGASFIATKDCTVLHLPHERKTSAERAATNRENRKKLHRQFFRLDTELYYYYPGPYYNQVLARYNNLVLKEIIPDYSLDILTAINDNFLKANIPSLLIGIDHKLVAQQLPTTHIFLQNLSIYDKFCKWFSNRKIHYLLGCDTPYADRFFKEIILTDFIRLLPRIIQYDFFKEMHRIGEDIIFLYTANYFNPIHNIDECKFSSLEEIESLLNTFQLQMIVTDEINGTSIIRIQKAEENTID